MNSHCQKNDVHLVRRRLLISGLVQGVGFRWEYRRVAEVVTSRRGERERFVRRVEQELRVGLDEITWLESV